MAAYRFFPLGVSMRNLNTIFTEAVEVAFVMCNKYSDEYSVAKILDLVQQIIPSAYVYGTAYWMFFRRNYNGPLCVCKSFGLFCSHLRFDCKDHLDMNLVTHQACVHVVNRKNGQFGQPVNFSVEISPQYNINLLEVTISFMLETFSYQGIIKISQGFSPVYVIRLRIHVHPYLGICRYLITPERRKFNTTHSIVNHPTSVEFYSTIFPALMQKYLYQIPGRYTEYVPGIYLPSQTEYPPYTLVPFEYLFEFPRSPVTYTSILNYVDVGIVQRNTSDKSTQTEEEHNVKGDCYVNILNSGVYLLHPTEGKCLVVNGIKLEFGNVRNEVRISHVVNSRRQEQTASASSVSDDPSPPAITYAGMLSKR